MKIKWMNIVLRFSLAAGLALLALAGWLGLIRVSPVLAIAPAAVHAQTITSTACTVARVTNTEAEINDEPVLSANGNYIAFWSTASSLPGTDGQNPDHNPEIFRANVSGSSPNFIQLTHTQGNILGGFNFSPAINEDGDRIVFFSDDIIALSNPSGNFEIFQAEVNGSTVTLNQLTHTAIGFNITPALNHNGTRVAFVSDEDHVPGQNVDGHTEIFVLDLSGTPVFTQVTRSAADVFGGVNQSPVLSADGQWLAFVSNQDLVAGANSNRSSELFLYNIPAGHLAQLTTDQDSKAPVFDATGSRLAFTVAYPNSSDIWLYTDSPATITAVVTGGINRQPALDAGGNYLAFVSDRAGHPEIYLLDRDTGLLNRLTYSRSGAEQPSLSADPNRIRLAFTSEEDGNREVYLSECQLADLSLDKTGISGPVPSGTEVVYTLTIHNNGSTTVENITVRDFLSPSEGRGKIIAIGSAASVCTRQQSSAVCHLPSLSSGSSETITVTVETDELGELTNTANVTARVLDRFPGNNSTSVTTTIEAASADLSIVKTHTPDQPVPGQVITYQITVYNDSQNTVRRIRVIDQIPNVIGKVSWVCTASPGSDCGTASGSNNVIDTRVEKLISGGYAIYTVHGTLAPEAQGTLDNTAWLEFSSEVVDTDASNNIYTDTAALNPRADLGLQKTAPISGTVGQPLTYTLTVHNYGPSHSRNVEVTDNLPAGLTVNTVSPGCRQVNQTVVCRIDTLAANDEATFTIIVTPTITGTLANTATVTAITPGPGPHPITDTVYTVVYP